MQYTEIFKVVKNENFQKKNFDIFLIFAQNTDCGYTLEPPPRGGSNKYGTHNLCFEAKIRKIGIPLHIPVLLYKSGVRGVYITQTCFRDVWLYFKTIQVSINTILEKKVSLIYLHTIVFVLFFLLGMSGKRHSAGL